MYVLAKMIFWICWDCWFITQIGMIYMHTDIRRMLIVYTDYNALHIYWLYNWILSHTYWTYWKSCDHQAYVFVIHTGSTGQIHTWPSCQFHTMLARQLYIYTEIPGQYLACLVTINTMEYRVMCTCLYILQLSDYIINICAYLGLIYDGLYSLSCDSYKVQIFF